MSLFTDIKAAGIQYDSHESDLYVLDTPEARAILARHPKHHPSYFTSDGRRWIDVPFAYDPWWEARKLVDRDLPRRRPGNRAGYSVVDDRDVGHARSAEAAHRASRKKIRIDRKAYVRKGYVREDGTRVRSTRVPRSTFTIADPGRPGRTARGAERGPHAGEPAWIHAQGALGGPGYANRSNSERRRLLAGSVAADGYRTTLGRISVLLRSTELHRSTRLKLEADRRWLVRKYGGPGSFKR